MKNTASKIIERDEKIYKLSKKAWANLRKDLRSFAKKNNLKIERDTDVHLIIEGRHCIVNKPDEKEFFEFWPSYNKNLLIERRGRNALICTRVNDKDYYYLQSSAGYDRFLGTMKRYLVGSYTKAEEKSLAERYRPLVRTKADDEREWEKDEWFSNNFDTLAKETWLKVKDEIRQFAIEQGLEIEWDTPSSLEIRSKDGGLCKIWPLGRIVRCYHDRPNGLVCACGGKWNIKGVGEVYNIFIDRAKNGRVNGYDEFVYMFKKSLMNEDDGVVFNGADENNNSHSNESVTKVKILRHPAYMWKQIEYDINDFIKDVTPVSIAQYTTLSNVFTTILYKEKN